MPSTTETETLTDSQRANLTLLRELGSVTYSGRLKFSVRGFHSTALDALVRLGFASVVWTAAPYTYRGRTIQAHSGTYTPTI